MRDDWRPQRAKLKSGARPGRRQRIEPQHAAGAFPHGHITDKTANEMAALLGNGDVGITIAVN